MDSLEKFQNLLRELFQFELSDLDFGVYRIFRYKRDKIEKFINEDLKNKIEAAFERHKDEKLLNIAQKFEEIKNKAIENLGREAFSSTGDLKEEFKNTPIGKDFLEIKQRKEEAEKIDEIKNQVYNDLYTFFSRYYEEGDFAPQYRYSIKGHRYAIPYNGEEVKLYWANADQYYTKTGLLFKDYTFNVEDYKVVFRIVSAKEELGSNKATKQRYFILDDDSPIEFNKENKTLLIKFQYRELFEEELKKLKISKENIDNETEENSQNEKGKKVKQEDINLITLNKILNSEVLNEKELLFLKSKLLEKKDQEKTILIYHLNRFTAKNTTDYFIHKNLKKFLSEQLDYFIKAEVLDIETIEKEKFLDKHITRAKVVREVGEAIIDFLSQIEDFQKKLWEKKKFVIKTEYVITTDRVPEEFYEEILKNQHQKEEWKELGFEIPKTKQELKTKKLPIDTKHFSQEFKEKLLEKLTESADLDDLLDGVLIKSENWQALNLLLEKYKEKIQIIYIDPPYNTGNDGFLYRDRYQHSSWLTMMENRLSLTKELMKDDGVIFVSIDDREQENLKKIMLNIFGKDNFIAQIIRDIPDGTNLTTRGGVKTSTEYVLYFINLKEPPLNDNLGKSSTYREVIKEFSSDYIETRLTKRGNKLQVIEFPKGIGEFNKHVNVTIDNGNYINPDSKERIKVFDGTLIIKNGILQENVKLEAEWSMPNILKEFFSGKEVYDEAGQKYEQIFFNRKGVPYIKKIRKKALIPSYLEIRNEKDSVFIDLFGYSESPKEVTVKPILLIEILVNLIRSTNNIVFDFFAGFGTTAHAVMKLNKEDNGKRKFILVEMADYFDTIIIPRVKKVAFSLNWKEGKPLDEDGSSVFFKYHYLEQYEDTLDNIELNENKKAEELFKDDYLLKYFLDYETRESPYLLNIDMLKNPFSYQLKVNLKEVGSPEYVVVDIPETFNYLLGIKVKKIKVRNNKRKYLFILGEKEARNIAIVWREYSDSWREEDFKEDKEFIIKEIENWQPHIVYVNGQSVLTPKNWEVRYIEPEFKKLMFQKL